MLANDMHLGLRVPIIWYKAQLNYEEAGEQVQVTGVSLPGLPGIVVGTNNHIAWGFTNANVDNVDWIALDDDTQTQPYTRRIPLPDGEHTYTIEVSQFGPVRVVNQKRYALNWVAHQPFAVNLGIINLGAAKTSLRPCRWVKPLPFLHKTSLLLTNSAMRAGCPWRCNGS